MRNRIRFIPRGPRPDSALPDALGKIDPGTDSPDVLRIQPKPLRSYVSHKNVGGRVITAIARVWREGDTGRCGLCPPGHCCAYKDACLIQIEDYIPTDEAGLTSAVGRAWDDDVPAD